MTVEDLINYYFSVDEAYILENAFERIAEVDENITIKDLLKILKNNT